MKQALRSRPKRQPRTIQEIAETADALMCWSNQPNGRERIWCKVCRDQGQPWITPEPCSHILEAEEGQRVTLQVAMNTLRELLSESNSQASADRE